MFRFPLAALAVALASPATAADCTADVLAAFEKQRASKAFRVAMTQPTADGPVQMTVDYMPPNRMRQTVIGANMPGEQQTILIGDRAFAGSDGAFEELLPQFTQSIISEVQAAVGRAPQNLGAFECLGKASLEGKDLIAYRTLDADAAKNTPESLARTVYIDPASSLPAFNIVAARSGAGEPVLKATYSYPSDIEIVAPAGAPVQKAN
ncbi:MAG: hypothetical protein ACKVP4_07620 [Hyphomicrobium sp.]